MQIQQTSDYSLFKLIASNRDIDKKHVRNLVTAIRAKNMLQANPLIVNEQMEVLDGQHRLEAAKVLQVPVFYIVGVGIQHSDMAKLNTNKKNWQLMDYINYHTIKGVKEFKELSKLINEFPSMPISFLVRLINGEGSRQKEGIVSGVLNIENISKSRTIISQLADFAKYFDYSTSSRFLEAFMFIAISGKYDHSVMLRKLDTFPGSLRACANKRDYIKLLQEIYNKGTHERNIVLFTLR